MKKKSAKYFSQYYIDKKALLRRKFKGLALFQRITLREKCPYSELFCSECGKMQTRITPNMDTFHAVSHTSPNFNRREEVSPIRLDHPKHLPLSQRFLFIYYKGIPSTNIVYKHYIRIFSAHRKNNIGYFILNFKKCRNPCLTPPPSPFIRI